MISRGMELKKITQEKLTRKLLNIEERKGKKNMASPSIKVIYDDVHKDILVYLTDIVWHEAHTKNGMGICFTLTKGLADELMLKLQMEPQMSQDKANAEMLSPNERNKHNDY